MPKMKAVQVSKPNGPFEVVERDIREPGPGEGAHQGRGVRHLPQRRARDGRARSPGSRCRAFPGHEIAGRVDAVGPNVTAWKAGDRVGVGWHGGHCFQCNAVPQAGSSSTARRRRSPASASTAATPSTRSFRSEAVARIPDELDAANAGPLLCAGVTTYNALRNSGARAGDTVAVQGIGGLGHLAIQYAARMGFRTIALSSGADKEELARQLGAHEYIDTEKVDGRRGPAEAGRRRSRAGDRAEQPRPSPARSNGLKPRGKLLIVAAPSEPLQVSVFPLISGKTIAGWPSGTAIDSEETMAFSALTGRPPAHREVQARSGGGGIRKVMENRVRFRAVLLT